MKAYILSIGDELVLGQTVDTNSAWLSQQLASVGFGVVAHKTVGDDQSHIEAAIREAAEMAEVILVSGGLGPTDDDLTRQAIASVIGVDLVLSQEWLAEMQGFFTKLGRTMPQSNAIQAMIPRGASMLWNTCGTAAGIRAKVGKAELFAVPGVPKEMKAMFHRDIFPFIQQHGGGAVILQKTLHTFGVGESTIGERLGPLMKRGRNPSVGTTVAQGIVSLRVNARFESLERAQAEMTQTVDQCRAALGDLIYGEDGVPLQNVAADLLRGAGKTIATAESCTGGLVAKLLTDVAGSSGYFTQAWVTYSNASKQSQLGVADQTLKQFGAVSEETVREMAAGALARSQSDLAISISGIAGPDGGTEAKPVGTVCFGLAHAGGVLTRTFVFPGDREWVRDRASKMALTLLRFHLMGKPLPF